MTRKNHQNTHFTKSFKCTCKRIFIKSFHCQLFSSGSVKVVFSYSNFMATGSSFQGLYARPSSSGLIHTVYLSYGEKTVFSSKVQRRLSQEWWFHWDHLGSYLDHSWILEETVALTLKIVMMVLNLSMSKVSLSSDLMLTLLVFNEHS